MEKGKRSACSHQFIERLQAMRNLLRTPNSLAIANGQWPAEFIAMKGETQICLSIIKVTRY
jgi:hypothetical protein